MKTHSISFAIKDGEIGYAVLKGQQLIFWEVCSFISDPLDALKTARGTVQRCIDRFAPDTIVLESLETKTDSAGELYGVVREAARQLGIPVFETDTLDLMKSFGYPPPKEMLELRRAVASVFTDLPFAPFAYSCLDAAARGLYFETNRLLNH